MKKQSIWLENMPEDYKKLDSDLDLDILIIGGGITGLSCAYHLMSSNLKVAVLEANLIGRGVTSKTTGKLTYLQEDIYSKIKKYVGPYSARNYYKSQKDAINIVKKIIEKNNIDCDFIKNSSYCFTEDEKKISTLRDEKKLLESFGAKVYEEISLPDGDNSSRYAIYVLDTYVFHPLKYLYALKDIVCRKMDIYEDSRVLKIDKKDGYYICSTDKNKVKAKKVIIASHYPYFLLPFLMVSKASLEKSYVGAFKVLQTLPFNAISVDNPVKSIRYHDDGVNKYKIFLYGSHNIGFKNDYGKNFSKLEEFDFRYEYLWSNTDVMTLDSLPYVGLIDNDLYLATGYNTWGMTNGSLAGKVISDMILEKKNQYIDLFNPKRKLNMGKIINFPIVLFSTMKSYVGTMLNKNKSWYRGKISCGKRNGKDVYIYKDDLGDEHIVYSRCPHLGCPLTFNMVELTWDCPCHGSRFNLDGICIDGPSNYSISLENYEKQDE